MRAALACIALDVRAQLRRPVDLLLQVLVWSATTAVPLASLAVLLARFGPAGPWSAPRIGVLYGVVGLGYDGARMIGRAFDDFHRLTEDGSVEVLLVRPGPLVLRVLTHRLFVRRSAGLITSGAVLCRSAWLLTDGARPTARAAAVLVVAVVATAQVFLALLVLYAATCFVTVRRNLFSDVVVDSLARAGTLPLDRAAPFLRAVTVGAVPLWWTTFVPVRGVLLGPPAQDGPHAVTALAVGSAFLAAACAVFTTARRLWRGPGT